MSSTPLSRLDNRLSPSPVKSRLVAAALLLALSLAPCAQTQAQDDIDEFEDEELVEEEFFEFEDDDFFMFDEEEETDAIGDPFENFNRAMFSFNDTMYRKVLKPVARGLRVLPVPVRTSASNFFTNLGTPISSISALLQGDVPNAASEAGRFVVNSTLGILGLFDPATPLGLAQDEEDMGQTFARYGVPSGPYLVLPLFGSSSLRDAIGMGTNAVLNPVNYELETEEVLAITFVEAEVSLSLDQDSYEKFHDSALDPYIFFRSAWVQNREGRIAR